MTIKVFIHVPELPSALKSLDNILARMSKTEIHIYDNVSIVVCCTRGFWQQIKHITANYSFDVLIREMDAGSEDFEYPTLHEIWAESQNEDFFCLYMHAKGASKTNEEEYANSEAWANFMMFGVIDHWEDCIHHLERGAELVGSQWHWHFKGNFWWADSRHLKEMPNPMQIGENERFNAEYWCCLGLWWQGLKKPRVKNLFYLPDLKDDSKFKWLLDSMPLTPEMFTHKYVFIDKRIDPKQDQTLSEFINMDYKCALDEIYITESDLGFENYIKLWLNYDGTIYPTKLD